MQSRPAEIPEEEWTAMGTVYEEVDQIDLYVGGLAETAVTGDIVVFCRSSLVFSLSSFSVLPLFFRWCYSFGSSSFLGFYKILEIFSMNCLNL